MRFYFYKALAHLCLNCRVPLRSHFLNQPKDIKILRNSLLKKKLETMREHNGLKCSIQYTDTVAEHTDKQTRLPPFLAGSMCSQWHKWHLFSHIQHCKSGREKTSHYCHTDISAHWIYPDQIWELRRVKLRLAFVAITSKKCGSLYCCVHALPCTSFHWEN